MKQYSNIKVSPNKNEILKINRIDTIKWIQEISINELYHDLADNGIVGILVENGKFKIEYDIFNKLIKNNFSKLKKASIKYILICRCINCLQPKHLYR